MNDDYTVMDIYYIFILASRHHVHLGVGATANLADGIRQHRARTARRLNKKHVFQKLVYVESARGVAEAVARHHELSRWNRAALYRLVQSVNPGFETLSVSQLTRSGYGAAGK